MANKTAGEGGVGPRGQPSQVGTTWFPFMAQSPFGSWENMSTNLTGRLGVFIPWCHVALKAIYNDVDRKVGLDNLNLKRGLTYLWKRQALPVHSEWHTRELDKAEAYHGPLGASRPSRGFPLHPESRPTYYRAAQDGPSHSTYHCYLISLPRSSCQVQGPASSSCKEQGSLLTRALTHVLPPLHLEGPFPFFRSPP